MRDGKWSVFRASESRVQVKLEAANKCLDRNNTVAHLTANGSMVHEIMLGPPIMLSSEPWTHVDIIDIRRLAVVKDKFT
jgi:hypothetical protein